MPEDEPADAPAWQQHYNVGRGSMSRGARRGYLLFFGAFLAVMVVGALGALLV